MGSAHVESIDALKELRGALWKFAEAADQSLSEANADIERMLNWVEHEAHQYWQGQIRQRRLNLNLARESLRSRQAVTRPDGSKPRAVEEEQAVARAEARLHEAEEKVETVKQAHKTLQREVLQLRGLMQRFVTDVRAGIPEASAHLEALIGSLTQYAAPEEVGSSAPAATEQTSTASITRPVEPAPAPQRLVSEANDDRAGGSGPPDGDGEE